MNNLYIENQSYIHLLDPRIKLMFFIVSAVIVFFLDLTGMFFYSANILLILIISKSYLNVFKVKYIMLSIFIFSFLIWSFANSTGTKLIGPFTTEGVEEGLLTGLRLISLMSIGIIMISTTKIEDLSIALIKFGLPYKLVFSFTTTLRLIPIVLDSVEDIRNAQKLRGIGNINRKASPIKKLKENVPLLIPIIAKTLKRTNDLAIALEVKCFGIMDTRTQYNSISFSKNDGLFLVIIFVMISISLYIRGL